MCLSLLTYNCLVVNILLPIRCLQDIGTPSGYVLRYLTHALLPLPPAGGAGPCLGRRGSGLRCRLRRPEVRTGKVSRGALCLFSRAPCTGQDRLSDVFSEVRLVAQYHEFIY